MSDLIGQTIGNYRIEALLGIGGMGQVFQGRHIHIDRLAAIKVLHESMALDPGFQARFRQEAKSVAALQHPNIVEIYDFGEQGGRFYLVLEMLADGSLRTLLQRYARTQARWPLALGLELVGQAADALAYAHVQGIIHRDIKPDNILLRTASTSAGGDAIYILKLSDFGLAYLAESAIKTVAGTPMGTPAYMSPEQCQGQELDGRSDIYSLGIVLYEITTGLLPFSVKTMSEAVYKHMYTSPPPPRQTRPDIPVQIEEIILRCLAKKPEERYATANDLSIALQRALCEPALALYSATVIGPPQGLPIQSPSGANTLTPTSPTQPPIALTTDPLLHALLNSAGAGGHAGDAALLTVAGNLQPGTASQTPAPPTTLVSPSIGVALDHDTLELTPGQPATVRVTLANTGSLVDHLDLSVEGVPKAWVRGPGAAVQLNPGAQTTVLVHVLAPRAPDCRAGEYPVKVRARSQTRPAESGRAPARWTVLPFTDSTLAITPARASGREGATYAVTLHNNGNAPASYRLSASDDEQALLFRFQADNLQLEPGQSMTGDLQVRARRRVLGSAVPRAIGVEARADHQAVAPVSAQFSHRALIPIWVPPVALGLLLLLCFAVYGLLAQRPIFEQISSFEPNNPQPGQAVTLHWRVARARTLAIQVEGQPAINDIDPAVGSYTFTQGFSGPAKIKLTAWNYFGFSGDDLSIGMIVPTPTPTTEPGAPQVSFSVAPQEIRLGEAVTLNWAVTDAETVEIEQIGTVPSQGQQQDRPQVTTSYKLVATSKSGKITRSVQQVIVINPTPAATAAPTSPPSVPPDNTSTNAPVIPPTDAPVIQPIDVPTFVPTLVPTVVPTITKTIAFATRATGIITGNEAEFAPLLFCVYAPTTQPAYPAPATQGECPAPEAGLQLWQPMIEAGYGLTSGISNSVTLIAIRMPLNDITLTFWEQQATYQVQAFDAQNQLIATIAPGNDNLYRYHLNPDAPAAYLKIQRQDGAPFWIAQVDMTMNSP